jgi:hypothetical protein
MTVNNKPINKEKLPAEISTIDQLARSLAGHTRLISDEIIMPALKQSKEYKPIIEFFHSVQKHLIHSPDEPEPKKVILATEDTENTEAGGTPGRIRIPNSNDRNSNDQNNAPVRTVESPQAFKNRPKDTSIELSYRTGTLKKLLPSVRIYCPVFLSKGWT